MKFLLFFSLFFFSYAEANSLQAQLKNCKRIFNDTSRLECYDSYWDPNDTQYKDKVVACRSTGFDNDKRLYCFDNINNFVDISKMGRWKWKIVPEQTYPPDLLSKASPPEKADYVEIYQYPEETPIDGRLVITCKNRQTGLYIEKAAEYHSLPERARIITASLDENHDQQWNDWILYENRIIYDPYLNNNVPSLKNIIFSLKDSSKLQIYVASLRSNPDLQKFSYDLSGLENAIAPFKEICKLSEF